MLLNRNEGVPRPARAPAPSRLPWRSHGAWLIAVMILLVILSTVSAPGCRTSSWRTGGASRAAGAIAVLNATTVGATILVGTVGTRARSRRQLLVPASCLLVLGTLGVALAADAGWLWAFVLGCGIGTMFPTMMTLPVDVANRPEAVGAVAGLMLLVGYVGAAPAPSAFGALRDWTGSYTATTWAMVVVAIAAVVVTGLASGADVSRCSVAERVPHGLTPVAPALASGLHRSGTRRTATWATRTADPVRVDGSADHRRLGRRRRSTGTASSRFPRATCSPRSTRTSRLRSSDRGRRRCAGVAAVGASLLRAPRRSRGSRRHRQPVPPDAASRLLPPVLDAIEAAGISDARVVCANGKVFPMSESTSSRRSAANLDRMEPSGSRSSRSSLFPRELHLRRRLLPWHAGVAAQGGGASELKITIGQAQSNHWGAGGGGKLILPGVVSDETIESNHCAFVPSPQTHYGAYAGPMRSDIDEVATMCGLDCTMNVLLDTHGRVIEFIFGRHPARIARRSSASTRSTRTRTRPRRATRTSRSAGSSRRPTTCSSIPGGAACRPTSS